MFQDLPAIVTAIAACIVCTGCRLGGSSAEVEGLQAELRARDAEIVELRASLEDAERAASIVPSFSAPAGSGGQGVVPAGFQVSPARLEISSLYSGSVDEDSQPGRETFTILVVPRNGHGDAVRVAGSLMVEVFDFAQDADRVRLLDKSVAPADLQEHWESGLFTTGYRLRLRWSKKPASPEVIVHVRVTAEDGTHLDATETVRVDAAEAVAVPELLPQP